VQSVKFWRYDKEIWGLDAEEFVCVFSSSLPARLKLIFVVEMQCSLERWEAKIPISNSVPGVHSLDGAGTHDAYALTFFGGLRACIVRPTPII
jgi:hypothetical protein